MVDLNAESGSIRTRQLDGILQVSLDRPDRLNALSLDLQHELESLWRRVAADPSVRVVVLTGAGRAFSAGADTSELDRLREVSTQGSGQPRIRYLPAEVVEVPVMLAVNGLCVGGALRFVADADVVLAAESAWFSDPHVSLGQTSGPCALQLAARSSSAAVAPLVLAGSRYRMPALEAQRVGLVSEVLPDEELADRALLLAEMIAAQSPTAVRTTLRLLRARTRGQIEPLLAEAWGAIDRMWQHPDSREAARALAAGESPVWQNPDLEPRGALDDGPT